MGKYRDQARKEAQKIAGNYLFQEILAEILEKKNTTDKIFISDYPSGEQVDPGGDTNYSLIESANLLEDLSEFEETDSAYWEGEPILNAFKTVAALTYRNAVRHFFNEIIDRLNDEVGNAEIPWTLEDRYRIENPQETGILDWDPNYKPLEMLTAKQRERLEKLHQKKLLEEIQEFLKGAVAYI